MKYKVAGTVFGQPAQRCSKLIRFQSEFRARSFIFCVYVRYWILRALASLCPSALGVTNVSRSFVGVFYFLIAIFPRWNSSVRARAFFTELVLCKNTGVRYNIAGCRSFFFFFARVYTSQSKRRNVNVYLCAFSGVQSCPRVTVCAALPRFALVAERSTGGTKYPARLLNNRVCQRSRPKWRLFCACLEETRNRLLFPWHRSIPIRKSDVNSYFRHDIFKNWTPKSWKKKCNVRVTNLLTCLVV